MSQGVGYDGLVSLNLFSWGHHMSVDMVLATKETPWLTSCKPARPGTAQSQEMT